MKAPKLFLVLAFAALNIGWGSLNSFGQCRNTIKIDGVVTQVDDLSGSGLHLPAWLVAAQTLAIDQNVNSISVIEFTVSGTALDFSRVVSVTTVQTVPANKVWKIESIFNAASVSASSNNSKTFSVAGTYNWSVPVCVNYVCIQAWGPGGRGGQAAGSGGGGGGYAQSCISVTPGTNYAITVGTSGGGATTVAGLTANAGASGTNSGTPGGAGGTATGGTVNTTGSTGVNRSGSTGGDGGPGANGGAGGAGGLSGAQGSAGIAPGGGGGGAGTGVATNALGADGQVIITW